MTDETTSLHDELHQFVLHTRNRLEGLLTSLNNLKEAANESARDPVRGPCSEASIGRFTEQNEFESSAEVVRPNQPPTTEGKFSENMQRSATGFERTEMESPSDAANRLEAIKRRLAEQIENT